MKTKLQRLWLLLVVPMMIAWLANIQSIHVFAQAQTDLSVFQCMPKANGYRFRCGALAIVVNHLRCAGKDEAIRLLAEFDEVTDGRFNNELILICRCMFENLNSWKPICFGEPVPKVNSEAVKKFPDFPLAFSDGIPFLLVRGYNLAGKGDNLSEYLVHCKQLHFRESDLPTSGYKEATLHLIERKEFQQLYESAATTEEMIELIQKQAITVEQSLIP